MEVLFPIGLDRNGLPIEVAAEKKFRVSLRSVGREEFIKLCEKLLKESSAESLDTFFKLGHSFNRYETGNKPGDMYLTDDPEYRRLTQEVVPKSEIRVARTSADTELARRLAAAAEKIKKRKPKR